jgi:hypothetical protein
VVNCLIELLNVSDMVVWRYGEGEWQMK